MIYKKLIFLILLSTTNSLFGHKKLDISKTQQLYYEKHNEEFLKMIFHKYPNKFFSGYDMIPKIAALIPYIVFSCGYIKEGIYKRDTIEAVAIAIGRAVLATPPSLILYFLTKYFTKNAAQKDKFYQSIEWFLKNYNSDLDAAVELNLKKFIPKDTYSTFDSMLEEYLKHGDKYIKEQAFPLIKQIIKNIEDKKSIQFVPAN